MEEGAVECECVVAALNERLEMHDRNRKAVQEMLHDACDRLRRQVDEMEEGINKRFEEEFTKEENRLQGALNELKKCMSGGEEPKSIYKATNDAMAELLVVQSYELVECDPKDKEEAREAGGGISKRFELKTEKQTTLEWIRLRKPIITSAVETDRGYVQVEMTEWTPREDTIAEVKSIFNEFRYKALIYREDDEEGANEFALIKHSNEGKKTFSFKTGTLEPETPYRVKVKITWDDKESEWSDPFEFRTLEFPGCVWKECPDKVKVEMKYSVDENNQRIATKTVKSSRHCTVIGNRVIPPSAVTSWSVRVAKSKYNDGNGFYVGVVPFDINQDEDDNYEKCGWYFDCYRSALNSGPPHYYKNRACGPRKIEGSYVRTGNSVGVVIDTAKGELSFFVNGVNYGVAYERIPRDKPLVPCVMLHHEGDSAELDVTDVRENVDSSIPVPPNIAIKVISWDYITLGWEAAEGASFYQIEVNGGRLLDGHTKNTFKRGGLPASTEHTFRVRAVRGNSVSEWSSAVKARTLEGPDFSESIWRECPSNVEDKMKYTLGKLRTRVATKANGDAYCTVVGNTPIPPDTVVSWNVKLLKSKYNDGGNVLVGVAPSDIDQSEDGNHYKRGWYFNCYASALWSGLPHSYGGTAYGPRKKYGQYVHTRDSVGVVMDTMKGELSFILNNKYLGVAYKGIPLDKPLVPCVFLYYEGDSVELKIKKIEEDIISF